MGTILQILTSAMQFADIRDRLRAAAVSAAFTTAGGIICLFGLAFLIAAVWMFIAQTQGALAANLRIGGGLVLIGLIVVMAGRMRQPAAPPVQASLADMPEVQNYLNAVAGQLDDFMGKKGSGLQSAAVLAGVGFVLGRILRR